MIIIKIQNVELKFRYSFGFPKSSLVLSSTLLPKLSFKTCVI